MSSKELSLVDMRGMADAIAKSRLFPEINTSDRAMTLMLLCQAEGLNPIQALQRYNIIKGKPAKNADAILSDYLASGGKLKWEVYTDSECTATFTHPSTGSIRISWTMDRAKKAGLGDKANWRAYPRQMLKARVISEGVRASNPASCVGLYTPEEVQDFDTNGLGNNGGDNGKQLQEPVALLPPQEVEPKETVSSEECPSSMPEQAPRPEYEKDESKDLNAQFKELKDKLGKDDFYHILRKNKCQSLKDIKTVEQAKAIIRTMENVLEITSTMDGEVVDA